MTVFIAYGFIIMCVVLPLSLPPAIMERSWKRFFTASFHVAFGIMLPLATFFLTALLIPDWKGGCKIGWIDCFYAGKLFLTPLVIWACAAFYSIQIFRAENRYQTWSILGVFTGAVVSGICLVIGLVIGAGEEVMWGFLIPLYTCVWHTTLFIQATRERSLKLYVHVLTLLGSLPFWAASIMASMKQYQALPDTPPDCFVVTAAMHGHEGLVGPFTTTKRRNELRQANQQLLRFWKLEEIWKHWAPRSHRGFRRIYNVIGPRIAKRMDNILTADAVFLLLKPLEFGAVILVYCYEGKKRL